MQPLTALASLNLSLYMRATDPDFWKRKLAAFLHDPPHKPFHIAGHEDARESFWNEAHLSKDTFFQLIHRTDDHIAAAADRIIFPHPTSSGVRTDWKSDTDCAFHHTLGGDRLLPDEFPRSADAAEAMITRGLQRVGIQEGMPDEVRWWRLWREWPEFCAREHSHFAYLAADTRVPHHTLWHHNGLVSALSTCNHGCSFLLFQIGPVQDFIKQARSTRDLWAGSYLLSYLIARAMFAVARECGPESIVFPQLRGAPLIDYFGMQAGFWADDKQASNRRELLTPNLPNRFLALVPSDWQSADGKSIAWIAESAVHEAWGEIAGAVHRAISDKLTSTNAGWDAFWHEQAARFPVVDYVIHDWEDTASVLKAAEEGIPPLRGGWENHPLRDALRWAQEKIPAGHRDDRCYPLNTGFAWALHYAATDWKFAAARNARGFSAWRSQQSLTANVEKDHLDGRSEVLGGAAHQAFWSAMRKSEWGHGAPKNLFKGKQAYGALTTIKRLFPYVWLPQALDSQAPRFESVQGIADPRPLMRVFDALEDDTDTSNTYYAVLAMDGDDMGQWVSGSHTPHWKDILSGTEDDLKSPLGYFKQHWGEAWDKVHAPLTPSFHAALSEALANFSLYCAGQIVEAFDGQLLYAGGDDVLAMLPAHQAVDCAIALQLVFRGMDPATNNAPVSVQIKLRELFSFPAAGFICCLKDTGRGENCRPAWPLMVMGPKSTASVGIAIGHVRTPMQDVMQAARDAEHAAKAVQDKGALCLKVLKRSGEAVQFTCRFDSGVPGIWDELVVCNEGQSGRFIYRFLQKLKPLLLTVRDGRQSWEEHWNSTHGDITRIVEAELAHSIQAQAKETPFGKDITDTLRRWGPPLFNLSPENFLHFWMARAFLNRLDSTGKESNS